MNERHGAAYIGTGRSFALAKYPLERFYIWYMFINSTLETAVNARKNQRERGDLRDSENIRASRQQWQFALHGRSLSLSISLSVFLLPFSLLTYLSSPEAARECGKARPESCRDFRRFFARLNMRIAWKNTGQENRQVTTSANNEIRSVNGAHVYVLRFTIVLWDCHRVKLPLDERSKKFYYYR